MLSVRDGVTDDVLEEDLENTTSLLVDQARDTLDTTTAGKATDSLRDIKKGGQARVGQWRSFTHAHTGNTYRLSDTLNVITKNLAVTLSTTLSETLIGEKISCKFRTRPNELWCLYLATFATARHCVVLKC